MEASNRIQSIPGGSSQSHSDPVGAGISGQNECDGYTRLFGVKDSAKSSGSWDDPSNKLWSLYVAQAENHDKTMTDGWKVDTDGSLIFAGLFSAVVTGFLVSSLPLLQRNSGDAIVALLTQISLQQVSGSANLTINVTNDQLAGNPAFRPAAGVVLVNSLWIASLIVALTSALLSTLIQQWTRNYLRVVTSLPEPCDRGKVRSLYFEGVHRFRLQALVKSLPLLLQTAVFLFFSGIVIFVMPMDPTVYNVTLGLTTGVAAVYVIFTCLPALYRNCPFRTPISIVPRTIVSQGILLFIYLRYSFRYQLARSWRWLLKHVKLSGRHAAIGDHASRSSDSHHSSVGSRHFRFINSNSLRTFMRARLNELRAFLSVLRPDPPLPSHDPYSIIGIGIMGLGYQWDYRRELARDCAALGWTINVLSEGKELEPFIEGIPEFVAADDDNAHTIINLFHEKDLDLGSRMEKLLWTCTGPTRLTDDRRICRSTIVLRTIRKTVTDPRLSFLLDSFNKDSPLEQLVHTVLLSLLEADSVPSIAAQVRCTAHIIISTFLHELLHPEIIFARKIWWDERNGAQSPTSDLLLRRASVLVGLGAVPNRQDIMEPSPFTFQHLWGVTAIAAERYRTSDAFDFNQTRQITSAELTLIEERQIRQFASPLPPAALLELLKEWVFSTSLVSLAAFLQFLVEDGMKANACAEDTELMLDTARSIFHSITCAAPGDSASGANKVLAMILAPITQGRTLSAAVLKSLLTALEQTTSVSTDHARIVLQTYAQSEPNNIQTVEHLVELLPSLTSSPDQVQAPPGFQIVSADFESRRPPSFDSYRHQTLFRETRLLDRARHFLRDAGISKAPEPDNSANPSLPRYVERDVHRVTGRPYYLYLTTRSTSWQIPETISANVDRYFTADGIPYYIDHSTWTTSWEAPATEPATISLSNDIQPVISATTANIANDERGPPPRLLYSPDDIEMEISDSNQRMQLPGWLIF